MSMHSHFKHKALEMHTTKKIKQPMSCFAASAGAHRYHRQSWAVPSPPALAVHHTTKWCHLCRCKACKDPNQACRLLSASHSSQVSQTWEEKLEQRRRPKEKPKPYVQAPSSAKPRCQVSGLSSFPKEQKRQHLPFPLSPCFSRTSPLQVHYVNIKLVTEEK